MTKNEIRRDIRALFARCANINGDYPRLTREENVQFDACQAAFDTAYQRRDYGTASIYVVKANEVLDAVEVRLDREERMEAGRYSIRELLEAKNSHTTTAEAPRHNGVKSEKQPPSLEGTCPAPWWRMYVPLPAKEAGSSSATVAA